MIQKLLPLFLEGLVSLNSSIAKRLSVNARRTLNGVNDVSHATISRVLYKHVLGSY